MPKRKITPELWAEILDAYESWDTSASDSGTIDNLLEPFGISKQAFYTELRRRGLSTKTLVSTPASAPPSDVAAALLEALVDARIEIRRLQAELERLQR